MSCVSDVCDNLHNHTCLYADDSTIYYHLQDEDNAIISLRKDLQKIYEWGQKWNVLLVTDKCKVMSLSDDLVSCLRSSLWVTSPCSEYMSWTYLELGSPGAWVSNLT